MHIRAARQSDLPLINALQAIILPGDEPVDTSTGHWWIALDKTDALVGFAGLSQSSSWTDTMYLCRSGVRAFARGQGIQKRLIAVRETFARRANMNWLITDTYKNPASANSLISCGFQMYEPKKPWSFRGACYWRKKITPKEK